MARLDAGGHPRQVQADAVRRRTPSRPIGAGADAPRRAAGLADRCAHADQEQRTLRPGAFSVPIESEPKLQDLVLTRFLHANRYPLRSKTLPWTQVEANRSVRRKFRPPRTMRLKPKQCDRRLFLHWLRRPTSQIRCILASARSRARY